MQICTPEQIKDSSVPQLLEAVVEVTPQERVQNRFSEQMVSVPVPRIMEAHVDVKLTTPQERVQNRTSEQISGVPVPQVVEERVQNRTLKQTSGSLVPQIMEAVVKVFPAQERVQSRTQEQIMDSPVPQIIEDGFPVVPQGCCGSCACYTTGVRAESSSEALR